MKKSRWRALKERVAKLPLLGLIIAFISASLFGLCNVIVKQVSTIFSAKTHVSLLGEKC